MSCAKVTAMVFPMVVNSKDVNKYRRVTVSGDSSLDSDIDSLSDSTIGELPVKYEMDSSLAEMKMNKGSQTDIMFEPPHYPAPSPPIHSKGTGRDKRKVRVKDYSSDKMSDNSDEGCYQADVKGNVEQRIIRCENCASLSGSSTILDTPVDNEPVSGTASTSVVRNEREVNPQPVEDSCAMECLYYAVQCSDCTLL